MENFEFKHVKKLDLKVKYIEKVYGSKISKDEISNSDVWVTVGEESGKLYNLLKVMKRNAWDDPCAEMAMITHLSTFDLTFEHPSLVNFYLYVETHYVNNGIDTI